jgi:hypothetical protein
VLDAESITIATYLSDVVIGRGHTISDSVPSATGALRHRLPSHCGQADVLVRPPPTTATGIKPASQGWRVDSSDHGGRLSQAFLDPPAQGTKRPALATVSVMLKHCSAEWPGPSRPDVIRGIHVISR